MTPEQTITSPLADEFELAVGHGRAIELVTEALAGSGFGVLTRIDVHDVFKAKLDLGFRPYTILGACNPHMARRALEARADVGLLLPCNVVVEEVAAGRSMVRIGKPTTLMDVGDLPTDPALGAVAVQVAEKLTAVAASLKADNAEA